MHTTRESKRAQWTVNKVFIQGERVDRYYDYQPSSVENVWVYGVIIYVDIGDSDEGERKRAG